MSKKPISIAAIGDIRKSEREEPPTTVRRKRGREPYVQLNTRISLSVSDRLTDLIDETGMTMREVVEGAIQAYKPK